MEIDITLFVTEADPFEFSASRAERGDNAGRDTWNNAKRQGGEAPLLTTAEQLDAFRDYVRGFGAWEDDEINAWSETECNALFVQMISGDMREAGFDEVDLEDFDWPEYERRAEQGTISGRIYHGDNDRIYYYIGE